MPSPHAFAGSAERRPGQRRSRGGSPLSVRFHAAVGVLWGSVLAQLRGQRGGAYCCRSCSTAFDIVTDCQGAGLQPVRLSVDGRVSG